MEETIKRIHELDLEPVMFKLVMEKGWTLEEAQAVEKQYKEMLILFAKEKSIVPFTKEIDEFWHQHILDTQKYAEDCENAFGFFVHHYPYSGIMDKEDALRHSENFRGTLKKYQEEFGSKFVPVRVMAVSGVEPEEPYTPYDPEHPFGEPNGTKGGASPCNGDEGTIVTHNRVKAGCGTCNPGGPDAGCKPVVGGPARSRPTLAMITAAYCDGNPNCVRPPALSRKRPSLKELVPVARTSCGHPTDPYPSPTD